VALTDRGIQALEVRSSRYLVSDGQGLNLEVLPSGKKSWIFRYRLNGKPGKVVLNGQYPDRSLKAARVERARLAGMVAEGKSPAEEKRLKRQRISEETTLREFGDRYFDEVVTKNRKNTKDIRRHLDKDIYPSLGRKKLKDVTPVDIQRVVYNKRDQGRAAAAGKMRETLKSLFSYAASYSIGPSINPVLSVPAKYVFKAEPRNRSLSPNEIRIYLHTLYQSNLRRQFKLALHLILLTLVRKSELMLARWEHINFESGEWDIPAEHTKNGKPHVVYLSTQAADLFRELRPLASGSAFVLPGRSSLAKPFSPNALNKALEGVTFEMAHFTIHDMRRTASTLLHERDFPSDVIEKALNHTIGGVRGIYNKAEYAEQRRKMLQFWADFVEGQASEKKVLVGNFMRA
jgi:integrase